MKYYKRINNQLDNKNVIVGVIYKEDDKPNESMYDLKTYASHFPESYKEVTERDYLQQELNNGNLVEGGYYVVIEYGNIFKYKTSNIAEYYLGNSCTSFCRNGGNFDSDDVVREYRLATEEEIEWLEACNRADEFVSKEGMYKEDFVLPEKWCIKVTGENIEILSEWVKSHKDISSSYLDVPVRDWVISDRYDGSYQKWSGTRPSEYKEITFEQFKKYVLKMNEKDELPKYWFIKNKYPEVREYLTKKYGQNFNAWKNYSYIGCDGAIKNNGVHAGPKHCFYNDAIEITIEEFRKYTNNLNEEKVNKKIIGYKLIKPEYKEAINNICGVIDFDFKRLETLTSIELGVNKLKHAGVLDIWFEPIFEEEFKVGDYVRWNGNNPTVGIISGKYSSSWGDCYILKDTAKKGIYDSCNIKHLVKITKEEYEKEFNKVPEVNIKGYKAQFTDDSVKFGCQEYSKDFVLQLGKFLDNSGLKLEDSDNVMNVVNHFRNLEDGDLYPVDYGYEKDNYDDFGL